jgi:serine/threonine protein kinase
MKGAFQDRQNCYLLMDYLDGGDLRYYINRNYSFTEEQTRILSSILRVLNSLPRRRIESSPSEEYHT